MNINDLRYDLTELPELSALDISALPDSLVVLLHDQYSTLYSDGVPAYLVSLITTWIALEKDAASDYQDTIQRKDKIINELRAQLGYDVDIHSGYEAAS